MNVDKFFEKYSIEEISKKTKISPISLRYIKNKEFDKIPRVKLIGFLKIIEREFNVNLSDILEEYTPKQIEEKTITKEKTTSTKNHKNILIFIIAIILLIIGIILLYKNISKSTQKTYNIPTTNPTQNNSKNKTQPVKTDNITIPKPNYPKTIIENNNTNQNKLINTNNNNTTQNANLTKNIIKENNITNNNIANEKNYIKKSDIKEIKIIPKKLLWFRAINLDTNKTFEYLTSKPKILPGQNYFIKFGHGEESIVYGNQTITPNTKKVVRILLKNGKYKYVQKGFKP